MDRLTIDNCEIEFCSDCQYHGEPNGCNRVDGVCDSYNFILDLIFELTNYRQKLADGLMVELPCKVGDTVYVLRHRQDHYAEDPYLVIELKKFDLHMLPSIGKTVFTTREEAEKALDLCV